MHISGKQNDGKTKEQLEIVTKCTDEDFTKKFSHGLLKIVESSIIL